MFFWAIFYGFTSSEGDITGDLIHHMNTAWSPTNQTIFSKDYLYSDPTTTAYYSPQEIWSAGILYRLTDWTGGVSDFMHGGLLQLML